MLHKHFLTVLKSDTDIELQYLQSEVFSFVLTCLSDKEKIILSMIVYLSEEKGSCFASNKYIANIVFERI